MRIRWTPAASEDLEAIGAYLSDHLPAYAKTTIQTLHQAVLSLAVHPYKGRMGRVEGTRELVVPRLPYIVAYRVREAQIEVLHVHHGAQERL
jgi:addiction module RelE/StbE family toxin